MWKKVFSKHFEKQVSKLKGQELENLLKKIDEICSYSDLNHYKNLRKPLQQFKRVHVNNSYVILFQGRDNIVYFYRYYHHDRVYKLSK